MQRLEQSADGRYVLNGLDPADNRWANETAFRAWAEQRCVELAEKIRRHWVEHPSGWKGVDVYTGAGGVLLGQFKLSAAPHCAPLTSTMAELVQLAKRKYQLRIASDRPYRPAFLDGVSGFFVALALCSSADRDTAISRFVELSSAFLQDPDQPFEMLYGAAGYLHGLLLIRQFCGAQSIPLQLLYDVLRHIVEAGARAPEFTRHGLLAYWWHGKMYLGGAHGLCGIYLQLLYGLRELASAVQAGERLESVSADEALEFVARSKQAIRRSISYLVQLQFPSGNLPSNPDNPLDRSVQWCHGSVGLVPLLCVASEMYEEPELLRRAAASADTIWERGLLWKGTGLCHGVSGNGYVFLTLYRYTQEAAWLHKARAFAWFASEHVSSLDTPDHPWSLFEGRMGELCFLHDCIEPNASWFPCYELPR